MIQQHQPQKFIAFAFCTGLNETRKTHGGKFSTYEKCYEYMRRKLRDQPRASQTQILLLEPGLTSIEVQCWKKKYQANQANIKGTFLLYVVCGKDETGNTFYYIGRAKNYWNLKSRLMAHENGTGSRWESALKLKLPTLFRLVPNCSESDQDNWTNTFRNIFGTDFVRGGAECQVELSAPFLIVNRRKRCSRNEECHNCERKGHQIRGCLAARRCEYCLDFFPNSWTLKNHLKVDHLHISEKQMRDRSRERERERERERSRDMRASRRWRGSE